MNFKNEQPRTEILPLCFFFFSFDVVSAFWTETLSTDLSTPGSEVPPVTGHDF